MKTLIGLNSVDSTCQGAVVAIGNFDGCHLGHQGLFNRTKALSKLFSVKSSVYTFNPHPLTILRPNFPLSLISTPLEKRRLIEKNKIDLLIEEPFDLNFSKTTAEDFLEKLLSILKPSAIVVGHDFGFGKDRLGSMDFLKNACQLKNIRLEILDPILDGTYGQIISSKRIRLLLQGGNLTQARELLGYPFFYSGEVVHGDARGRRIGFPTANLSTEDKIKIPHGVYATLAEIEGLKYISVSNFGVRPTFQDQDGAPLPKIETHLIEATKDLYEKQMTVYFLEKIRDEMKFLKVEDLKSQIEKDIEKAKLLLVSRK